MRCCAGDEGFVALRRRFAESGFKPVGAGNSARGVSWSFLFGRRTMSAASRIDARGATTGVSDLRSSTRLVALLARSDTLWVPRIVSPGLSCSERRRWVGYSAALP
jgi:hypothetical protein